MMKWAKKLGWIPFNPVDDYTLTLKKYKRKKLDMVELIKIENKQFFNPSVAYVKDLFLFSCYTGLAYCDAIFTERCNRKYSNIRIHKLRKFL